ncbi:MAG TPA: DUF3662 and FHA domain-containing protein, partial [Actinomycetota bacterium]|nr:DUF3662 and FHA domain-containing protein [Actinomycetota bacterium]
MGIADEFERRLERLVEGVFNKAFKSSVQPAEIGRRIVREMERSKSVSVGAVYVPNLFSISLSPTDHARLEGLFPSLSLEFAELVRGTAREKRWKPTGAIVIEFQADPAVAEGRFDLTATHGSAVQEEAVPSPRTIAVVSVEGSAPAQNFELTGDAITIGRSTSSGIALSDPNASRDHAQLSFKEDAWWLTDLGSTNGTLVNDTLIKERRLTSGDRIRIGSTILTFHEGVAGKTDA